MGLKLCLVGRWLGSDPHPCRVSKLGKAILDEIGLNLSKIDLNPHKSHPKLINSDLNWSLCNDLGGGSTLSQNLWSYQKRKISGKEKPRELLHNSKDCKFSSNFFLRQYNLDYFPFNSWCSFHGKLLILFKWLYLFQITYFCRRRFGCLVSSCRSNKNWEQRYWSKRIRKSRESHIHK